MVKINKRRGWTNGLMKMKVAKTKVVKSVAISIRSFVIVYPGLWDKTCTMLRCQATVNTVIVWRGDRVYDD